MDIPIVTAGGVVNTQRGPAIAIMHQYAYTGKGKTIHSCGQLEWYKNDVNDKSIKVQGGLQCILTLNTPMGTRDPDDSLYGLTGDNTDVTIDPGDAHCISVDYFAADSQSECMNGQVSSFMAIQSKDLVRFSLARHTIVQVSYKASSTPGRQLVDALQDGPETTLSTDGTCNLVPSMVTGSGPKLGDQMVIHSVPRSCITRSEDLYATGYGEHVWIYWIESYDNAMMCKAVTIHDQRQYGHSMWNRSTVHCHLHLSIGFHSRWTI